MEKVRIAQRPCSTNVRVGSKTEVQRGSRNVRSWGKSGSRFRAAGSLLLAKSGSWTRSSAGSISTSRLANFGRGEGHRWGPVSLSSLMLTWWLFTADGGGRGRHGRDHEVAPARAMNTDDGEVYRADRGDSRRQPASRVCERLRPSQQDEAHQDEPDRSEGEVCPATG